MSSTAESVLGITGVPFLKTTDWLVDELDKTQYSFLDNEVYEDIMTKDPREGAKIEVSTKQ